MNKRQLKMQETKKSLEEAINKILISKDFKDITIKEICNEANVAVGTFYNYYNSKEELVWKAIERDSKHFNYIDNEKFINDSLRENLIKFAECYCNYFKAKGTEYIKQIFISKL
ncbi:MAG: TetR/AcrR family transcriptional regulator, partial [Sarcina sp.]